MQTRSQHMLALGLANETRVSRAEVKCQLHAGEITFAAALADPCCQKATVWTLVTSVYGVGDATAGRLLSRMHIGPARRVGELTDRQRDLVVAAAVSLTKRRPA